MPLSDWASRVLSGPGGPSTKRHIVAASAGVLCLVTVGLGIASTVWIWRNGDLGAGAVSALTFAAGILAGLAGSAYRKKDGAAAPPATENGAVSERPAMDGSAKNNAVFAASPDRGQI